ncbi:MAG: hypothetical protein ACRDU8_10590 [Egibacteraceae bacterium]
MDRKWVSWLVVYAGLLAVIAWRWSANPTSPQGLPADPMSRIGLTSVLLLPLGLMVGRGLGRMDADEIARRYIILGVYAVATLVTVMLWGFQPDDIIGCLRLRDLPVPRPTCQTTAELRLLVTGEATVDWLLLGGVWAAFAHRQRQLIARRDGLRA